CCSCRAAVKMTTSVVGVWPESSINNRKSSTRIITLSQRDGPPTASMSKDTGALKPVSEAQRLSLLYGPDFLHTVWAEKKEWLCLNCQTQRALSGSLGDTPAPAAQPMGSPRSPATANQQSPQQKGPNQLLGPRPTGPQQQKPPGPQVSGPVSPVKQAGPAPHIKGPSQASPQTKGSAQPKGSSQPPSQTKGPTQPSPQSKGPQNKGPNQSNAQSKGPVQSANQTKGQSQAKGPTQTKGSAQPSAQTKGPSHPPGAKAPPGKTTPNHAKASPTPSKTAPTQSKPTGNNQARKQMQSQEKTKVTSKSLKEDVKAPPKKALSETVTSPKDMKIVDDTQKSRHHEDYNKSSTQSLSDTGYSSDGIYSSHGEITGQIVEEGIKLSGSSIPSEIKKLESSMKPLLESKSASNRPHSLSVGHGRDYNPDDDAARDESEDDLSCKLRHDYVEDSSESGLSPLPVRQKKSHKELTDEEFMRSFEDDTKASASNEEEDVVMAGGLRRFKTIELNNTNSYNRDMELSTEHDLREPELEMESLTGSPEERSKGEYSSTLPATTPSYTSGTSPTSVSSMEDDSDSSPSRRARLEEAKQQRKARHRSHGPLLPTIEDSSEEDELREEEELLREQEQMRDLEQQRIRSTARKTKRDKEELRAQRRRERSKTPPSNLSPIEDASPTEELRQAAEMEELHRSSCSEYSPSMDSEAEGYEMIGGKLYKSGNEYNLPTFTSLYSPTEKTSATSPSDKTLKSAEEVYEEMMKKAQLMQRCQPPGLPQCFSSTKPNTYAISKPHVLMVQLDESNTSQVGTVTQLVKREEPPPPPQVLDLTGQIKPENQDGQVVQAVVAARPIQSSASEMSLRSSDKQADSKTMKKQNSMPRLRDGSEEDSGKKITDSCVQTDDEDGEDRFMNRRRRTRRIADSSVQTDEEDQGEWDQQPVRRRRSRVSKHSESSGEAKSEALSKVASASIASQTTNDSSCQTEPDQLGRNSPAIHITMAETSKVDLLHYIAAPERTHKGESLACQTEPESQSQGVVAPQLSVPTTISPYSTSLHIVGANTSDPTAPRLQGVAKFERRKPDPLEIGYQQNDSPSRQPPKSPQVLYSPVSPLSPHRMLETTFASQEKLNKAHVTPQQKAFTAESPHRHQSLPRPIKSVQRSMSDPKPLSPTSEDPAKNRFSPYHQQAVSNSQMASLQQQQNSLMRKIKRTLPSPPPEESPLPIVTPAQMYSSPGMPQRVLPRPAQGVTKAGLLSELKAVEQESSKLRKQQAELEEEEKEIDAKLRYLELGIHQRKETMVKDRERRELAYLRCMGDARDYMSDSELNNLRMVAATGTFDGNGLLTRPSTAPLSQFTNDLNPTSQYPSTSSYPYPQSQPSTQQPSSAYQQIGFQPPQYPSSSAPQPGTFQPHPPPGPGYQNQGTYSNRMYAQTSYQADLGMQQHGHQGFHPPGQPMPSQSLPYPSHSSYQPVLSYQPQADILTVHQRPRQTSLADLEQKLPTNYEVISNPSVSVATSAPDTNYGSVYSNAYGQYRPPEPGLTHSVDSPTSAYASDGVYTSNLEQNIPRNYVMIDDISELTKDGTGQPTDALGHHAGVRYRSENGPARGSAYGRPEDEPVEVYGRPTGTAGYQSTVDSRTSTTVSGGSSNYYDDYKHPSRSSSSSHKVTPKNLAPAVVSSKRSKHRKQGMEQKISKFSPIEEARDVESDLASYTMTTSTGGSCTVVSRSKKPQDDVTYGMKKNAYDQQKYYGTSREGLEEEDRMYSSGRSRSTGYGMDKISSRDATGHRSKSYERDAMERSQRTSRSGRPPMRSQNSEEESPLSPVGQPVGIGRGTDVPEAHDVRNQYGSSHSLPDVQDHHKKDLPRSHVYKPDDPYLVDDMHCAVSDSEAYHLGQEETDWFEKPRERNTVPRMSTTNNASPLPQHHGITANTAAVPADTVLLATPQRIPGRPVLPGPTPKTHPSAPMAEALRLHKEGVVQTPVLPREAHETQATFHVTQPPVITMALGEGGHAGQQRPGGQGQSGRHPGSEPLEGNQQAQPQHQQSAQQQQQQQQQPLQHSQTPQSSQPTTVTTGAGLAQQQPKPGQAPPQGRQPGIGSAAGQPATTAAKIDATPAAAATGIKPTTGGPAPQPTKIATPPLTGIGSKAPVGIGSKPVVIGNAAAGPAPAEGDNVLTKILQGGAAEQAGKLGDALSGFGKKFTSLW
ncbi:Protein bassoon, partial [Dissostichus eleginoides]